MRNRVRLAIVLTLLAGAVCADRSAAVATPKVEAGVPQGFVARLSGSLGRTVARVRFVPQRRPGLIAHRPAATPASPTEPVGPVVSPCQFSLPPPTTVA